MKKTLLLLVLLCGMTAGAVQAEQSNPTDDIKPVLHDLTSVLQDESLKGNAHLTERRAKIMSLIKRGFDFREMSKRVLGRTWREIDAKEQDHFTVLMTKLLENVYIGKLESYSGQTIEFASEVVRGDRAQVSTLVQNGNTKIPVHYIMMKTASRWMVYDINIEGVSLVRNYQEQFRSILRTDGYQGLVKILEEKDNSFAGEAR